jgi:AcrR family transcriptional regulator
MIYEEKKLTQSGKKTRDLIFNTAVRLLKEEGYDALTTRRICELSGTSNGSFYHFFRNKDELLAYYYRISAEQFLADHKEELEAKDLYGQLMLLYQWYIRYSADYGVDFCMNFFNAKNRSIDPAYTPNAYYEISRQCLHGNLDQLAEGEDPEQVAMELCVMAKGIIFSWANERGDFDIDQIAEHMFGAYIRSVIRH